MLLPSETPRIPQFKSYCLLIRCFGLANCLLAFFALRSWSIIGAMRLALSFSEPKVYWNLHLH
jgi:hypothetical protein